MDKACANCGNAEISEALETDNFQYGVTGKPDTVMLSVDVPIITCNSCKLQYTDQRAEKLRDGAVRKHLASKGIHMCVVCGINLVDVDDGYDTCGACL